MSSMLYKFRGWILGIFAIALLIVPGAPLDSSIVPAGISAAALLLASIFLRVQARRSIGEHTRGYVHAADTLVTTGVYSRVRHPLYISNAGIALAFILWHFGIGILDDFDPSFYTSYILAAIFAIVVVAFEITLSKMEDRFLEKKFGDQWRNWAAGTPAFFPLLRRSKIAPTAYQRTFVAAFIADKSSWFWILVFVLLLTLRKFI